MNKKSYAVVGGSSGIGWSLLQQLSAAGAQVYHYSRAASLPTDIVGVKQQFGTFFPIDNKRFYQRLHHKSAGCRYDHSSVPQTDAQNENWGFYCLVQFCRCSQTGMPFHTLTATSKAP